MDYGSTCLVLCNIKLPFHHGGDDLEELDWQRLLWNIYSS